MTESNIPFLQNVETVKRKNALYECGALVGRVNIKLATSKNDFETVAFYCTKPRGHQDQFDHEFTGADVIVKPRR